jgi:hypothetical protein
MKTNKILSSFLFLFFIGFLSCNKIDDFTEFDEGKTVIPKTTKIIPDDIIENYLRNIDSDYTLTFSKVNKIQNYKKGDILLSGKDGGFLRRIVNINENSDEIIITTEQASLTEAFEKMNVSFDSRMQLKSLSDEYPKVIYKHEGVTFNENYLKSGNSSQNIFDDLSINLKIDLDNNHKTLEDQIILSGKLTLEPNFNGEWDISYFNLNYLKFEFEFYERLELKVIYPGGYLKHKHEEMILLIKFHPIYIQAGPAPIWIEPELVLLAGIDFNVNGFIETSIVQDYMLKAGIIYENNGWDRFEEVSKNFSFFPPKLNANASAEAFIKPKINFKIYKMLAPNVSAKLYTKLEATTSKEPWWSLYRGFTFDAGIKMAIFKSTLADVNYNFFNLKFPIAHADGSFLVEPTVLTKSATNVSTSNATLNGEVLENGGDAIIETGFYYSQTNSSPNANDDKVVISGNLTNFSKAISNLKPDTRYHYRGWARNDKGIGLGNVITFNTDANYTKPSVETLTVIEYTKNSAVFRGNVSSTGGQNVTERGFYYSLSNTTPNSADNIVEAGNGSGSFSHSALSLQPNTTYYVRAWAKNNQGIGTGNIVSFITSKEGDIDGVPGGVNDFLSNSDIEKLENSGLLVYTGVNPPNITGNYYCNSWENFNTGVSYINYTYQFYNQTNDLKVSVKSAGGNSTSEGFGAFLSGSGDNFTVYCEVNTINDRGHIVKLKTADIYSGKITTAGISNFQKGFIILEKENDINNEFMNVGETRVVYESDGLAEKVNDFPFTAIIKSLIIGKDELEK